MAVNPNLKPFKKGQSGNPGGLPKHAIEAAKIRRMQYADFIDLLQKCSHMSRDEIALWLKRPEATMFELMFGTLIAKAAKGDHPSLVLLSERLFGKIKDVTESLNVNIAASSTEPGGPVFIVELNDDGKFIRSRPREVARMIDVTPSKK